MELHIWGTFKTGSVGQVIGNDIERVLTVLHTHVCLALQVNDMLIGRVRSIEYECHRNDDSVDIVALVSIMNPPLTSGGRPNYVFVNRWATIEEGKELPGRAFAAEIVTAAAKASGLVLGPAKTE